MSPVESRAAGGARHRLGSATLWLVVLFVLSLPAVTPRLYASDEIEYFAFLRSLWFDGDLSFDNEYRYFYDRQIARAHNFHYTFLEIESPTGRRINFGTIGCAFLWAPFYGVADLGVVAARALGSDVPRDGYSRPYLRAVTYGSAVYGFLAVLVSAGIAARLVGRGRAASLLVWLSTPLLFYMYLAPGMAHANSAFVVSVFVAVWLRVRERWSAGGVAGLAAVGALMVMVREQDVLLGVGPAIDFAWSAWRAARAGGVREAGRFVRSASAGAVVAAVVYAPQVAAYLYLNGHVGPAPQVSAKLFWHAPHALEVLASTEHGWFFWTPMAVVSLAGLVLLAVRPMPAATGTTGTTASRDTQWLGVLALVMVASQIYVNGSVDTWSQAGAFGQRRFVALTVLLVLGLARLLASKTGVATAWGIRVLVALCVWWNLGLMAQFGANLMNRRGLELGRNAYNNFVAVPVRLPELAYRYVFDRSSFYQQKSQ